MGQEETIPSGFAEEIGTEWIDLDPDNARARIKIEPRHLQPFGIVHGGVYATLAESICSAATYDAVREDGMVAMGQSNDTTFLRPSARATSTRRPDRGTAGGPPGSGTSR